VKTCDECTVNDECATVVHAFTVHSLHIFTGRTECNWHHFNIVSGNW